MPYILRNKKGEITGTFAGCQYKDQEYLSDEDPDVISFNKNTLSNLPKNFLKPISEKEVKRLKKEREKEQEDFIRMNNSALAIFRGWTEVEMALSGLFNSILNLPKEKALIANVIYYNSNGLYDRISLVDNVVNQFIEIEKKYLLPLTEIWMAINNKLDKARKIRNKEAHGAPVVINYRGKQKLRWTSVPFDHKRVGKFISKNQDVGVSVNDLNNSVKLLHDIMECIDSLNITITEFIEDHSTLKKNLKILNEKI